MADDSLRILREDDADAVAEVFRAGFGDERSVDGQDVLSWFHNSELKPECLRVLEVGRRVVGYGDISTEGDELVLDMAAPGHWEAFLNWAELEARARQLSRVRTSFPAGHELERMVEGRGYRLWRSAFTMEMELGGLDTKPTQLPNGIALRDYGDTDAETVRAALNEAFARDPYFHEVSPSYFREFYLRARGFDPSLWLLAWGGEELAGFVLASAERAGDPSLGWIGTLGVLPPWRRRGLGEALLRTTFTRFRARGYERVGLGVDVDNETGALRLYERVGMHVVRQYDNWVREV